MLSRETLEEYRRMTPGQRLRMTMEMIEGTTADLLRGSPELVKRRFELLRQENDLRNDSMLRGIARTRKKS